jgi:hypothetical protein
MTVKTISQTFKQLYEVNIDFDQASLAWKANKKSISNRSYRYLCSKKYKNNKNCMGKCLPGVDYCKTHIKIF